MPLTDISKSLLGQLMLKRKMPGKTTSKGPNGHTHTYVKGQTWTSFDDGHRHMVLQGKSVTEPASANKHTHKI